MAGAGGIWHALLFLFYLPMSSQPWITPSIFDNTGDSRVVDEFTYGQFVPSSTAASVLKSHWDTWITESGVHGHFLYAYVH